MTLGRHIRAIALSLTLAVLMAAPAQAAPLVREHYSGTDTFSFTDCGFLVEGSVSFSGLFMLKSGRQGDPTPYLFDNYEYHIVFSNPANGKWFTQDGNGLYKDLHITNVEGSIYTFVAMESGRPFIITDMDGNRFMFDRGRLLVTFMVDTMGDADLENDVFIEGSFELLADRGAHPGFYIDFCVDVVQPLLG